MKSLPRPAACGVTSWSLPCGDGLSRGRLTAAPVRPSRFPSESSKRKLSFYFHGRSLRSTSSRLTGFSWLSRWSPGRPCPPAPAGGAQPAAASTVHRAGSEGWGLRPAPRRPRSWDPGLPPTPRAQSTPTTQPRPGTGVVLGSSLASYQGPLGKGLWPWAGGRSWVTQPLPAATGIFPQRAAPRSTIFPPACTRVTHVHAGGTAGGLRCLVRRHLSASLSPHCSHNTQALLAAHCRVCVCASAQACVHTCVQVHSRVQMCACTGLCRHACERTAGECGRGRRRARRCAEEHWELGTTSMMMSESHWESGFTEE